jgi:hypothetical protein
VRVRAGEREAREVRAAGGQTAKIHRLRGSASTPFDVRLAPVDNPAAFGQTDFR